MSKNNNYRHIWKDKERIEKAVKESVSLRQTIKKLGISWAGSHQGTLKKYINIYQIDVSHFRTEPHNKGTTPSLNKQAIVKLRNYLIQNILVDNTGFPQKNRQTNFLKKQLIRTGLLENRCAGSNCGIKDTWEGKDLALQLEHKNGNSLDNRLDNLELLCPNCHAGTHTYRNKTKTKKIIFLPLCLGCNLWVSSRNGESSFCTGCVKDLPITTQTDIENNYEEYWLKQGKALGRCDECREAISHVAFRCNKCAFEKIADSYNNRLNLKKKHSQVARRSSPKSILKFTKQCQDCPELISSKATRCRSCNGKYSNPDKIKWPTDQQLLRMIEKGNYSSVGRELGVSDNAIRKHLRKRGLIQ